MGSGLRSRSPTKLEEGLGSFYLEYGDSDHFKGEDQSLGV